MKPCIYSDIYEAVEFLKIESLCSLLNLSKLVISLSSLGRLFPMLHLVSYSCTLLACPLLHLASHSCTCWPVVCCSLCHALPLFRNVSVSVVLRVISLHFTDVSLLQLVCPILALFCHEMDCPCNHSLDVARWKNGMRFTQTHNFYFCKLCFPFNPVLSPTTPQST